MNNWFKNFSKFSRFGKDDVPAKTYFSVLVNQPSVQSGRVNRGRVCNQRGHPVSFHTKGSYPEKNLLGFRYCPKGGQGGLTRIQIVKKELL